MTREDPHGEERGRRAESPAGIPAVGWKDVAARLREQARNDNLPLLAAGVALYFLLALVPALIAAVSIYGLVADPAEVQGQVEDLTRTAPSEVSDLLASQLERIAEGSSSGATVGVVVGLAGALWAASSGMKHLIAAVNAAYGEREGRGLLALRGLSLLFTAGGLVLFGAALVVVAVLPQVLDGVGGILGPLATWTPYLLLAALFAAGLAGVYRYAPDRAEPRWTWVSWGSVVATVLWIVASIAFSFYVSNFGSYNETYGSLSAIVVLIVWLLITAYAVLLGAELNSELEAQTAKDTTAGDPRPMGDRGAVKADRLGSRAEHVGT